MTRAAGRAHRGPTLLQDALLTIGTRFGLAVIIFATDIVLAHLLGPSAKGRFALVLLTSQFAAVVVGWGMDSALGVVSRRDAETARRGFANALIWSIVVGGFSVVLICWAYGLPTDVRPRGPLASVIPNLSAQQFLFSALALPGELFFAIGLFALGEGCIGVHIAADVGANRDGDLAAVDGDRADRVEQRGHRVPFDVVAHGVLEDLAQRVPVMVVEVR